jgi:murein DD-endopeptidase MepM/ murein hydrolase activator NlpD
VTQVGYVPGYAGYGSVVRVQHRGGYSTLYAHLSRPLVRVGRQVWQGQRIGIAGCTGWYTGTHLHFELRYRNVAIDPSLLIVG